jgi:hypothetical protein
MVDCRQVDALASHNGLIEANVEIDKKISCNREQAHRTGHKHPNHQPSAPR